jgi:hypothetical protein
MMTILARALVVWIVLLIGAIANGAVREYAFVPRMGETAGHVLSTLTLCFAIFLLSWLTIGWIRPLSARDAWAVGSLWLSLTLSFEFLAGHYVFGHPWRRLVGDYNVFRGRVWILVLVTTVVAPVAAAAARGLLRPL